MDFIIHANSYNFPRHRHMPLTSYREKRRLMGGRFYAANTGKTPVLTEIFVVAGQLIPIFD